MKSLRQSINEAMIGLDSYRILCKDFANKASSISKDVEIKACIDTHGPGGEDMTFEVRATEDEFRSQEDTFKNAFEKMFRDACKIIRVPYKKLYDDCGGYSVFFDNTWNDKGMVGTGCLLCSESEIMWRYEKEMTNNDMCVCLAANCYAFFAVSDAINGTDFSKDAEKLCIEFVNNVKNTKEKMLHSRW